MPSFYQDRLGTNVGKTQKRDRFARAVHDIIQQTTKTEKPLRALEYMSLRALIKRAQIAKVEEKHWNENSAIHKMDQMQRFGAESVKPSPFEVDMEKKKIIALVIVDPDCHAPIRDWSTAQVKEWIWDIEGVDLDDSVAAEIDANHIRGIDLLHLTDDHLKSLGIQSISHRFRILEAAFHMSGAEEEISDMRADELVNQVLRLRGSLGGLGGFRSQPIPFFYVHLLFLISAIYLPMFAYSLAMTTTVPVRKRHFLRHLYIKIITLPRQARDKHRENSKKVPFSQKSCDYSLLGKNKVCSGEAISIGVYEGVIGAKDIVACEEICNTEDACKFYAYQPDHTCQTWASCPSQQAVTADWAIMDTEADGQTLYFRDYHSMCWNRSWWEVFGMWVIFVQNIVSPSALG
jgi:hypothetical protein